LELNRYDIIIDTVHTVESNKRKRPGCFTDRCSVVDVDSIGLEKFTVFSIGDKAVGVVDNSFSVDSCSSSAILIVLRLNGIDEETVVLVVGTAF
jgi:hypothetical protein